LSIVFIGDFRTEQLLKQQNNIRKALTGQDFPECSFLVDTNADVNMLEHISVKLSLLGGANIVIMLGFIDCVYSCAWGDNIDENSIIIEEYKYALQDIKEKYSDCNFNFCSVNPVTADYSFAFAENYKILKETLNSKIESFNNEIKTLCTELEINYIDSYSYLVNTNFTTHDGSRYTLDTCVNLQNFILSKVESSYLIPFDSRILKDTTDKTILKEIQEHPNSRTDAHPNPKEESYIYWINKSYKHNDQNGLNRCITDVPKQHKYSDGSIVKGSVLPNCTGYAWGRFCEILGEEPKLSHHNAEYWYIRDGKSTLKDGTTYKDACIANGWGKNDDDGFGDNDGYERGQMPKKGAVMCWEDSNGAGHVAIVEDVLTEDKIITSESGYGGYSSGNSEVWKNKLRKKGNGNWGAGKGYIFQGFIYCPLQTTISIDKDDLYIKNKTLNKGYIRNKDSKTNIEDESEKILLNNTRINYEFILSQDVELHMKPNAQYIWQYLGQHGWSINAVAALLGNLHQESTMTPNLLERSNYVAQTTTDTPSNQDIESYVYSYYRQHGRFPGYGLTQWTSVDVTDWNNHKLVKWCNSEGLDYKSIDSQLQRIIWEADNKEQWGLADYNYNYSYDGEVFKGLTFKDFTTSNKRAGWLAAAFAYCYEKPGTSGRNASAKSKYKLCLIRDMYATYWYDYLKSLPSTFISQDLEVSSFKVDKKEPTKVQLSAIIKNNKKVNYKLFKGTTTDIKTSELISEKTVPEKKEDNEEEPELDFLAFHIKDVLIPNTTYTVELFAEGSQDGDTKTLTTTFTTPQDYPRNVDNIKLSVLNEAFPKGDFKVSFEKPKSWGYWKKNNYGYEVALFVNNNVKKKIIAEKNLDSFNLNVYFKDIYNNFRLGDNIQIGIRTWVENDSENTLFSGDFYEMSNPICLLKKPVITYLNV
jgi:surface antigen